jgi:hypothetical protein
MTTLINNCRLSPPYALAGAGPLDVANKSPPVGGRLRQRRLATLRLVLVKEQLAFERRLGNPRSSGAIAVYNVAAERRRLSAQRADAPPL